MSTIINYGVIGISLAAVAIAIAAFGHAAETPPPPVSEADWQALQDRIVTIERAILQLNGINDRLVALEQARQPQ